MSLARTILGASSKSSPLWIASGLLLGVMLGSPDLWAHEGTWGAICQEMIRSGDYFHPSLFGEEYFDKPLLSYWLMIGAARVLGRLNEWALRLPCALSGFLTIWCTVRIGTRLFDRASGLAAGWLLLSCGVFTYWARLATADVLNIAAVTGGAAWYFERRERPGLATHAVFFAILALGGQMKGLVAPALTVLVLLPDFLSGGRWKTHLRSWTFYAGAILGAALYLTPFLLSTPAGKDGPSSSALAVALRESLGRYVNAFDHRDVYYVYAKYLPLYFLPWSPLLLPVAARAALHWRELKPASRWPLLAAVIVFLFLTLSQSRRNYYILPILPFLALAVADWLTSRGETSRWTTASAWVAVASCAGLLAVFGVVMPWVETKGGPRLMAKEVRQAAEARAPWGEWRVLLVSCPPQAGYYLEPSVGARRVNADQDRLIARLVADHPRTVVVTAAKWQEHVAGLLPPTLAIPERSRNPGTLGAPKTDPDANVALLPLPPER